MNKPTPQNIYDNPEFFSGYMKLRESNSGFNSVIEEQSIHSLLPMLTGVHAVDLGCGFGNFSRFLREKGASSVIGVDVSEKMLSAARSLTQDLAIQYQLCAIEDFNLPADIINLVVSSVALHYIEDYKAIVDKIYHWLKPQGHFIFSVEHPICTAHPSTESLQSKSGEVFWPIDNYRDEGEFKQDWLVKDVVKYHRTLQTYINTLTDAGFTLKKILEPMPSDKLIIEKPAFAIHKIRPPLLIISTQK